MSEQKQQEENTQQPALNDGDDGFSINDWSLKIREGNADRGMLALDGEDMIIVENIGQPLVKLKPINGDFSVIQYFTACASGWLASLKRSEAEILDAAETWLHFKAFKEKLGINASEFLDNLLPEDEAYSPGGF